MKKILTIIVMCISSTTFATEVLDSETTDFESEAESQYCSTPIKNTCTVVTEYKSPSIYFFNPTQLNGVFQVQPDWYMVNGKIQFVPVRR